MKKMLKKRSGFTLVELLIVIIIIGILAGSMLLLMGSSSDKAEATKIVSDLRSLKAAALMYYADGKRTVDIPAPNGVTALQPYMDRAISGDIFTFVVGSSDTWFVSRKKVGDSVQTQLGKMADEAGLLKDTTSAKYTTGEEVFMRAR